MFAWFCVPRVACLARVFNTLCLALYAQNCVLSTVHLPLHVQCVYLVYVLSVFFLACVPVLGVLCCVHCTLHPCCVLRDCACCCLPGFSCLVFWAWYLCLLCAQNSTSQQCMSGIVFLGFLTGIVCWESMPNIMCLALYSRHFVCAVCAWHCVPGT